MKRSSHRQFLTSPPQPYGFSRRFFFGVRSIGELRRVYRKIPRRCVTHKERHRRGYNCPSFTVRDKQTMNFLSREAATKSRTFQLCTYPRFRAHGIPVCLHRSDGISK